MNPFLKILTISILSVTHLAATEDGYVSLFDGKTLEGWTSARSNGKDNLGNFTVNQKEKAIHCYAGKQEGSKQSTDCLVTKATYSHYILKLEYKWNGKRFAPRADWDRDAGLLFHVHGDLKKIWPHSLEMQIGESSGDKLPLQRRFHTGDLFVLGTHLRAKASRNGKFYDPKGEVTPGGHTFTKLGVEKPRGEWNKMEIHVNGAKKVTFIMNGTVVLELFDIEQKNAEGKYIPLTEGRIGLQAEWAEILYRNIQLKNLGKTKDHVFPNDNKK